MRKLKTEGMSLFFGRRKKLIVKMIIVREREILYGYFDG